MGRWIAGALMALVAIWLGWSIVNNPNFEWNVVFQYLFSPIVLAGLGLTLWLTAAAMTLGIGLGIVMAVMRVSPNRFLSVPATLYLWVFRGTPILVQLIFWYNLAILIPVVSIGIPFGPTFFHGSANDLITPYTAALLGLGLNEGAYMAEIVRAGILSIDSGQQEAARALGMTPAQILRRTVLPQAVRVIVPPTGNETIGMLKTTSLVSVIALSDLLYSVQTISSRTFQTIPLLLVACLWYLAMTTVLSFIQGRIEKRLGPNRQLPSRSWWFFGRLARTVR
ncbi:amino acid ABC transporter permease [Mesorhizobium sp. M0910]|uniref:amino acid ABC transporter permease n=1 Tax=Mesorhizobium sp. M0910 TaxID=2957025 RepID=UPI0033355D28